MYPNNNQLGFPVDRPLVPLMRYDVNNPPFAPNLQVAQWLQPYLRYISGVLMDVITQNTAGPVSMHFYNNMSANNWANEAFAREVHNCSDFIHLKASQMGQNVDVGQACTRLIPAYVSLRSMFEIKLFPGLWQFIDPNDQAGINQQHYQFEQEMAQIMALRQGGGQPGVQVPMGQPMMSGRQGGFPQPVAPPMAGYGAQAMAPMSTYGQGAPVGMAARGPGGGRDYGNTAPATQASQPVAPAPYAPAPAPAAAPAPVQPQQPQGATMGQNETLIDADKAIWKPSQDMPYPMAYNPVTTKMCYKLENGKTIPFPVKNDTIDMINYDRHNISTLFGQPPENLPVAKDNGQIIQDLAQGVKRAGEEQDEVDGSGERQHETMGLKAILSTTALETAIQDVRAEMLAKIDRADPPMVFQAYSHIYTPIMGDTSEYALLRKFADSSSYVELREKVRAAGATASPEFITEVGLRLTELMNTILHAQLSILPSEVTVDDFVQDLDQLLGLLKSSYSEKVQKAFLKNQSMRIKSIFGFPDVDTDGGKAVHDSMVENALTTSWNDREDRPEFTFFGPTVRLTFLNVISHDLLLAGLSKVGNILTKQQQPALFSLAEQVFTGDNNGLNVARQLVITKDGRMFELFEANLVDGGFLVCLVK